MHISHLIGALALLPSTILAAQRESHAFWAADTAMQRGQGNELNSNGRPSVSYEHGLFYEGLRQLYERTGNRTYFDYIKNGVNNFVAANGTVVGVDYIFKDYVLDPLRTGPALLYLYDETGDKRYKIAADTFRDQLRTHPRTAQGQFWHKLKYPYQGWLDGVYMASIFYAQYTLKFQPDDTSAWDDIALQYELMYNNTVQKEGLGLLYHGYDYERLARWASADRGHSPEVWGRALGWYSMALVDILEVIPTSHPGSRLILNVLRTLFPKIAKAADPQTGVWWLVLTQPGREKNYLESSAAMMFVYSFLKAVRVGDLEDDGIVQVANRAYEYAVEHWVNGTNWLDTVIVGSLDGAGDFNYYVSQRRNVNDLKGVGAFLLAGLEYDRQAH